MSMAVLEKQFNITPEDKAEVLEKYFGSDGQMLIQAFPPKEKRKIIIMEKIMDDFEVDRDYSEKEVNQIIARYYSDFVTVRRYLIQYKFMDRVKDGSRYWVV